MPDAVQRTGPNTSTTRSTLPDPIASKPWFDTSSLGGEVDTDSGGSYGMTRSGPGVRPRGRSIPGEFGLYEITLNNTGSGWVERFLLHVPRLAPGQRAPLLVVFHRYGVSHWDAYYSTTLLEEARQRGWFVVAPRAAAQKSFNSLEGQINVQAALDFVNENFNVDPNRVYGVGFSMGGGLATNFAARHLDPHRLMFAAMVNHTGTVSQAEAWSREYQNESSDSMEYWYAGPPSSQPFTYQRCSVVDIDPATGVVGTGSDVARNLAHLPVRNWMANNDPIAYLRNQTTTFDSYLNSQAVHTEMVVVNGNVHSWSTLDDHAVCDWLSQFSLQIPKASSTLADEDGTYFWFNLNQNAAGSFTPFSWSLDPTANRISIYDTGNLSRLSLDATAAGLQYAGVLKLNLNTADGTGDQIRLENVTNPPVAVTRDGVPASGTWDPSTQSFLIAETDHAIHMWRLTF